jgi:Cell Wall Hydrolase
MDLSGNDLDNVTRTIMAEAGVNATPASQAAVASVILNRMASGNTRLFGGPSASDVVHHPNQFEPWNPGSGNDPRRFPADSPAYKQAEALAQGVFSGVVPDSTNGATHFFAPVAQYSLGRGKPSWTRGTDPLAEIGGHQFFAPNGPVEPERVAALTGQGSSPSLATNRIAAQNQPGATQQPQLNYAATTGQPQLDQLAQLIQASRPQYGGGGLLGNLMFGREGLMGLFPEQIQQNGIFGSLIKGLGNAGNTGVRPSSLSPIAPPQPPGTPLLSTGPQASLGPPIRPTPEAQQPPPPNAAPQNMPIPLAPPPRQPPIQSQPTPGALQQGNGPVIPGQWDPHKPGFDPHAAPPADWQHPGMGALQQPQQQMAALPLVQPKAPPPMLPNPQMAGLGSELGLSSGGMGGLGLLGSLFGGMAA